MRKSAENLRDGAPELEYLALAPMDRRDKDESEQDDLDLEEVEDRAQADPEGRVKASDDSEDSDAVAAPRPRRSLGPTLLVLGGGIWAIAGALHCGAPEPGPALSVSPDAATPEVSTPDPDAATPAESSRDEAHDPAPASDDPEPAADVGPPEGFDDAEPEEDAPAPELPPEGWAIDLDAPKKVTYTIRHGGSIKNVANLFKIFHHEITAMNPGIALEHELPPNSKVVVYLDEEGTSSESVGLPSKGTLEGGVPVMEGPGRHLKAIPWKSWGTAHTVTLLDQVLRQWALRGKGVQPVLVGNMAARTGGKLDPHSTHQSGRDVDLGYLQKLPEGDELNWREMSARNLDAAETWALLKLLRSTGQVEVIFIDSSIQKLLYDHAVTKGTVPKAQLAHWLEYPRSPPRRGALVQHVRGHVDHLHVRFKCQAHEGRCQSRKR